MILKEIVIDNIQHIKKIYNNIYTYIYIYIYIYIY